MKRIFFLASLVVVALTGCATDEAYRTEQEAGGTLPWNRPASWEGPGALGSQMNQFSR
jgi:hypothetical protein